MMFGIRTGLCWLTLTLAFGCSKAAESTPPTEKAAASRPPRFELPQGLVVARGLGGIEGLTQTNTIEALKCNHKRGFRWFEVDLALSADGELVAFGKDSDKAAGLSSAVEKLSATELGGKRIAGRFAIPRFEALLTESSKLGKVVLIVAPTSWSPEVRAALGEVVRETAQGTQLPELVLQVSTKREIAEVSALAKELGAHLVLTLAKSSADDAKVEKLARKYRAVAVVADNRRFTPWLAQRLEKIDVPLLVDAVNEHQDVVELTGAGADGFYTDTYLPYGVLASNASSLGACDAAQTSQQALTPWLERSALKSRDFRLRSCVSRKDDRLELTGCDEGAAIRGPDLAVPPGGLVKIELDVEAKEEGATFWFEVAHRYGKNPPKPREQITLKAGERRLIKHDVELPLGSPGLETRLGLDAKQQRLIVHVLEVAQEAPKPAASGAQK